MPDYAYLPGQNERHAEDAFASIRRTAAAGLDAHQLARCDAFRAGLQYLHAGYYWESHEVLEPVWMALPHGSAERQCVQGLIQLANGCLKLRMRRPKAALRLVELARSLVPADGETLMTVELAELHRWIDDLEKEVHLTK